MTSQIDPSVIVDDQRVDKADLREQFQIAKNEISALQQRNSPAREMAYGDELFAEDEFANALLRSNNLSDVQNTLLSAKNLSLPCNVETNDDVKNLTFTESTLAVITQCRSVKGDGGHGIWIPYPGDQSANITADPLGGIWLAPASDPTGASGAWQRIYSPGWLYAAWWGVRADTGLDMWAALQGAIDAAPNSSKATMFLPAGIIRTTDQIELPTDLWNGVLTLEGAGKTATTVTAHQGVPSWAGKAVIYRGNSVVQIGGGLRNMTVEALKLADYAIFFRTGKQTIIEGVNGINAVVTEGLFGDPLLPRFYETKFIDCAFYTGSNYDPADRPDYNFRLQGYATDNEVFRVTAANAKLANFYSSQGGVTFSLCHAFGNPGTHEADYCFRMDAGSASIVDSFADGFTIAGIYMNGNELASVANRFFWPSTTTGNAHLVASAKNGIIISENTYQDMPVTSVEVSFAGSLPVDSYIQSGLIKTDGQRMFLGHTQSIAQLNNGRLQISGSTFNETSLGQGRWSADASGAFHTIYKSRGATTGTLGLVSASDQLGIIDFAGDDGVQARTAVRFLAQAAGTPAAGVMPGLLTLQTAQNAGATLTTRQRWDHFGNVVVGNGAITTTATDGFLYIPTCAGTPTGTPRTYTGMAPLVIDSTNNKLYFYSNGAWRDAGP